MTMTFTALYEEYTSLSNEQLLEILSFGNLPEDEAFVLATVIDKRFPTPIKKVKKKK